MKYQIRLKGEPDKDNPMTGSELHMDVEAESYHLDEGWFWFSGFESLVIAADEVLYIKRVD